MVGGLLIPLYERIDAILVRYGSFNSTQKFRMSVIDYYLKHKDHFKDQSLDSLIANMLREEKILRDIIQEEDYISESGSYPAGLKIWKISPSNIGFMTGIFIDMNAHCQLGHFAGLMIRGDPNRSGISIQILQMTAQEEEDAAGGIVDTVRSVKKRERGSGGWVIALYITGAALKPEDSTY
ncbi:hypothetical protein N7486_006140 [Penicillium sp. IBT 16267x]|nr:hypothetical protein N7486_006140 [Penicillium sp. IBT 16267x]